MVKRARPGRPGSPPHLAPVDLPPVPKTFADSLRQEVVLAELEESRAETVVLLGDEPIRHWLKRFDGPWSALSDFGESADAYCRRHVVTIAGRPCEVLPLVHPGQAAGARLSLGDLEGVSQNVVSSSARPPPPIATTSH